MAKDKNFDFWSSKKMSYTSRDKWGAGDYYGQGERPKTGTMRQTMMGSAHNKGLKKPPKSIA